ncbi:MAG: hypothetical protein KOO63_06715 [Bacteroidales bacterium]|nr:hypothetical protein [Candidatus Latescibacterota bacterium]
MIRAAVIFIAVYIGLIVVKRHRWAIAWGGVLLALVISALSRQQILTPQDILSGINWNIIGIFTGSLFIAELFIYSNMPETISDVLINRSSSLGRAFLMVVIFASVFSIFMDNVITVLIIAPIALQLTRKAGVSPVPVVIGLAVSSNLQGMAILIGDTPSMLLAAQEKLNFLDFFFYQGKPSIFWIVQLGAIAGFGVLYLFFRKNIQRPGIMPVTPVKSWVPFWLIVIVIILLSFMNRIDPGFSWFGGTVCVATGLGGYFWYKVISRGEKEKMKWGLDWGTVVFLMAVFVLVHMLTINNVVETVVSRLDALKGMSPFLVYSVIVWGSVLISAFIDNIPYIAAMLPLVSGLSVSLGLDPALLAFGVLIGSCMGGNITPIGAAANLVAMGILEREGSPISFGSFVRIGLPFTLAATTVSWIVLWFIYN